MSHDNELIKKEIHSLVYESEIVVLATNDSKGNPHASFCPFVYSEVDKKIYAYLSTLSGAVQNIEETKEASIVLMEGSMDVETLFSHERLRLLCRAIPILKDSDLWKKSLELFEKKYKKPMGDISSILENLHLVELKPYKARIILGKDQILDFEGPEFSAITPLF